MRSPFFVSAILLGQSLASIVEQLPHTRVEMPVRNLEGD